jgi:hypothetical protein
LKYRPNSPGKIKSVIPGGKKTSSSIVSDIGIVKSKKGSKEDKELSSPSLVLEDSFEKYYNKDLDLEED